MLVVALVVGAAAPAFADDAPPATTEPATTTEPPAPSTTAPAADPPTTTTPQPDPPTTTTPDTTAPEAGDTPAALVNPALTVTPSTNLAHLQNVTVSGTGFTPNVSVGWAECKNNNSGDANDCDTAHSGFATTDGSGAFSASFVARRTLHTPNGDVDCATAPATCNIGAAKITDYTEHAGAPLTFDPNAPLPPPPTLLAGPLTNLHEGDSVALFGRGFVPNDQVAVVQCSQPSVQTCQVLQYLPADASGGFITLVQVHRLLATPPFGATDCADAPDTCQLRAVSISDYDFEAHVFLDFDPSGPLPAVQTTVTPDTDLLNFQSVTVSGSGFSPNAGVQIVQCTSDATSNADCTQGSDFAPTSATGTFTKAVTVRRVLHLEGGDVDCADAPGRCSLVSTSFGPTTLVATSPLDFDDSVPPPPAATVTVTPHTDLVQGQSVTVTGANFAPSSFVALSECLSGSQYQGFCSFGGPGVQTDATGAFTQQFAVKRGVPDDQGGFPPGVEDCAESPGYCSVIAFSFDGQDRAAQAIDFDPSVPIAVPDVTVSPRLDLPDRALVDVHASGLHAGERVAVSQCIAGTPTYGISCGIDRGVDILAADANGVIDTSLRVHRVVTPPNGVIIVAADGPVNCSGAVGACVLRVQSIDDPLAVTDIELGFDPTAVAAPPTLTVTPAGPYTDGQQVVVHGAGFTPNATLGLGQCSSDAPNPGGSSCDSGPDGLFTPFSADADGSFTRTVTLHTQVQTTDGVLDCSVDGSCNLFAANRVDYVDERASTPIAFAGVGVEVAGAEQTRALAFTGAGASTMPTALAGLALLVVGGALVLLARRRRV